MKKTIILVVVLTINFISFAQDTSFGVLAGFNSASLKTSFSSDLGGNSTSFSGSGFLVGGFFNYELSDQIAIMPELKYTNFKFKDAEESSSFIMLPIFAKYEVTDGISIMTGPQLNFLMSKKEEKTKAMSFSLNIGAMYAFSDAIFLQADYAIGLSNLTEFTGVKEKINFLNLSLGYKFN